jgi:hypothetical protein
VCDGLISSRNYCRYVFNLNSSLPAKIVDWPDQKKYLRLQISLVSYVTQLVTNPRPQTFAASSDKIDFRRLLSLWSSGQSSKLQIRTSRFDSRFYQIFWEVVGLEQGSLSLVSTIEELLGRKVAAAV